METNFKVDVPSFALGFNMGKKKGGSGGGGFIDVAELPTENINEEACYRIIYGSSAQVYIVGSDGATTLVDAYAEMGVTMTMSTYVVESLPEVMEPLNQTTFYIPVYIIESTGIGYMSLDGTSSKVRTLSYVAMGMKDKGWVDNIDDVDNTDSNNYGVYCVRGESSINLYTRSEGEWLKYIPQTECDEVKVDYENKIDALDYRLAPINYEDYVVVDGTTITDVNDTGKLKSVEIPNTIVTIGESAFMGCIALKYVLFEEGSNLAEIEHHAFQYTSFLGEITIPDSVTSIGDSAFNNSALSRVTIGAGVASIGIGAFSSCKRLTSITYKGTKAQWKAITGVDSWDSGTTDYTIYCTDGTIAKDGTET